MFNIGACDRVGVILLDIEHEGDNVQVKPEPRTDIGALNSRQRIRSDKDHEAKTNLAKQSQSNTSTKELAEVLD